MTPMPFAAPLARALMRSQTDARLVTLAREGHEAAFDEIVRRYRPALVAFAAAYAPKDRAEDVVQESLTNAWTAMRASSDEIALKAWLYTIVRNRALNARRDAHFHEPLNTSIDGVRQPGEIVLERDQLNRVIAAVTALPDPQRRALVDSALEGRTHDQIAATLGTTAGSVRGMIYRGRMAVRSAAGAAVPLPVVSALANSAGTATAGGAAAGTIAGGSLLLKGATVAAIAVLATGSGLVVEHSLSGSSKDDREADASPLERTPEKSNHHGHRPGGASGGSVTTSASKAGPDAAGNSHDSSRDDRSGPSDSGEGSGESSGDDSGQSGSDDSGSDDSGPGDSGSDDSGSGDSGSDDSGSGDSGSGGSGGGGDSSGPGSGDEVEVPELPDPRAQPVVEDEPEDGHGGDGPG